MSPPTLPHHQCLCCEALYRPSKRHPQQRFCAKPECRKASKQQSQASWLRRHPDYFHGPAHVERVRCWRAAHPGYSRGQRGQSKAAKEPRALQDLVHTEAPRAEPLVPNDKGQSRDFAQKQEGTPRTDSCNDRALQDLVLLQSPLLVGLISVLAGDALQETLVPFARGLVERGERVLGRATRGFDRDRTDQTIHSI